eukprot:m.14696 g.14696  ORF g.14696 m.14696 type:complete len:663 (-) comp5189_c0_seq1:63-2051(-)
MAMSSSESQAMDTSSDPVVPSQGSWPMFARHLDPSATWFNIPFGFGQSAEEDSLTITLHTPEQVVEVPLTATMDHITCKKKIMELSGYNCPDVDTVAIYTEGPEPIRVPCVFAEIKELLTLWESTSKQVKLNLLVKLQPWQRALERADLARYHPNMGVRFQPPDAIFQDANGNVHDLMTPRNFVGAVLCDVWEITSYIQSGSFGRGWQAKDLVTGENAFIKTFRSFKDRPRTRATQEKQEHSIRKEIEVLLHPRFREATSHDAVVSNSLCFGGVKVPKTQRGGEMFFIATPDLCEGGELFNYIVCTQQPYVRPFTEQTACRLFKQLVAGVAHLHKVGCYHRDLKLENLVLTRNFDLKIMDFGSVKFTDQMDKIYNEKGEPTSIAHTFLDVGTNAYKPPEARSPQHRYHGYYFPGPVDTWACGAILFFMIAGDKIYNDPKLNFRYCFKIFEFMTTPFEEMQRKFPSHVFYTTLLSGKDDVDSDKVPRNTGFWSHFGNGLFISEDLKNLLNRMFHLDPELRITMDDIETHDWLEDTIIDEKKFFEEMRSRPTVVSTQQFQIAAETMGKAIDLVCNSVASAMDDAWQRADTPIDAAVSADDMASCVIQDNRIEAGMDSEGHPLYTLIVESNPLKPGRYKVNCQWQGGDLPHWLELVTKLKTIWSN